MIEDAGNEWTWRTAVVHPSDGNAGLIDEAALAHENAQLRSVLGHCPTCIAVLDVQGCLVGYNRETPR